MKNWWCYFWMGITIPVVLFINGCNLTSIAVTQVKQQINISMNHGEKPQNLPIEAQLIIGDQHINLEVARTPEQQRIGLMYRDSLCDENGMLFDFSQPIMASFWMKNVNISLDMIFVDQGVVNSIAHNVPPCRQKPCPIYRSEGLIDQVIELRGGLVKELNIQKGDRLQIIFLNSNPQN